MITEITNNEDYNNAKTSSEAALFYFSHEDCNVCKVYWEVSKRTVVNNKETLITRYVKL